MREVGIDLQALKEEQGMADVDDFDFICHIAYGQKPLTRRERAENVRKRDIFHKYGPEARKVLEALLDKYMNRVSASWRTAACSPSTPSAQWGLLRASLNCSAATNNTSTL